MAQVPGQPACEVTDLPAHPVGAREASGAPLVALTHFPPGCFCQGHRRAEVDDGPCCASEAWFGGRS